MSEPIVEQLRDEYEVIDLEGFYRVLTASGAPGCVYGLTDPTKDHKVAYVGQTSQRVVARYLQHIAETTGTRAKACWMCELQAQGLYPGLVILERCEASTKVLLAKESAWVARLQAQGLAWVNPATKADPERLRREADARQREWEEQLAAVQKEREVREKRAATNQRIKEGAAAARVRKARQTRLENERQEVLRRAEHRRGQNAAMLGLRAFVPVVVK